MNFRKFIGLQLMMFLIFIVVEPALPISNPLAAGIVLNFAVFYLTSMLVGFTQTRAPLASALTVTLGFNLAFYLIVLLSGDIQSATLSEIITDFVSTLAFTTVGCYAGLRSRPQPSKQNNIT